MTCQEMPFFNVTAVEVNELSENLQRDPGDPDLFIRNRLAEYKRQAFISN